MTLAYYEYILFPDTDIGPGESGHAVDDIASITHTPLKADIHLRAFTHGGRTSWPRSSKQEDIVVGSSSQPVSDGWNSAPNGRIQGAHSVVHPPNQATSVKVVHGTELDCDTSGLDAGGCRCQIGPGSDPVPRVL